MKINGVKIMMTDIPGNLKVITIPDAKSQDEQDANTKLYTLLRVKCGGQKTHILSETERERLPAGTSLVFTYDSYTHIIPRYCELSWKN